MFRAQQNVFDDAVAKATDENLTSENWEYILDVCDRASGEESGPKDVVSAMIKRLAHRNANVQLYTLELANSLSQNCGIKVHRELASRSFTEALLRLASDRNTHQQVKAKILERMAEWTEMFSKEPDLGVMEQAYMRLKSQNPNLHPPSKPTKRQITDADRQKEEDELQMALKMSVQDGRQNSTSSNAQKSSQSNNQTPAASSSSAQPVAAAAATPAPQPISSGTTAATVSRVRALFDFQPSEAGELQFKKGDVIAVLESVYKDWWKGSLRGQTGIFPLNYVEKLTDPTRAELEREALMEAEVFAEIKNVEKLLTLLSTSGGPEANGRDNEEITKLYHSTLAIRPKLIELIGKYSQRKDDFTQLNEKFIKARRDYESLLEASMSQPPQQQYGRPGQAPYSGGYGGGYPPQGPPPGQADPGRYYSPDPRDSRTPQPHYPPQNGPQPFQVTGQAGAPPSATPTPYPSYQPSTSGAPADAYGAPPDAYGRRPQSTYDLPQELGTFQSPSDRPPQPYPSALPAHVQPQQQPPPQQAPPTDPPNDYSPSVYSPEDPTTEQAPPAPAAAAPQQQPPLHAPPGAHPLPAALQHAQPAYAGQPPYGGGGPPQPYGAPGPQQPQYGAPPPQQQHAPSQPPPHSPPQPGYQPPKVPSPGPAQAPYPGAGPPGPVGPQGAYPPAQQGYQAYQPQKQQGYAGAPGGNPNDFYR